MIGQRLRQFRIVKKIGAGGMGEVYRATDTKLGRDVAIKVLPPEFARDPERLARFEREARLLASLNHPNIAAIYGFENVDGVPFLVLEYVPGDTLAERIAAGPLQAENWVHMCAQFIDALEAAHEKGIIHRDLKPANIKITPEDRVKVLDFGLAKAFAEEPGGGDPSQSPTISLAAATRAGVILGTAAYMSPEQARGKPLDRRTDIWAFGCVLYELLAGRRAFGGESISDVMVSVLQGEPDWSRLPAGAPLRLLRRCLEKDPARRLRDIADARILLDEVPQPPPPIPHPPARPRLPWVLVALLAAVAAVAVWWGGARTPQTTTWTGEQLGGSTVAFGPRISPDGQTLAFLALVDGQTQVAVMKPDSGNWTVLTRDRSRGLIVDIAWSRDGTKIYFDRYFDAPGGVFSVPVLGGDERLVLEHAGMPQVLPDGSLLVNRIDAERRYQLHRFWPETGRLQPLPALPTAAVYNGATRVFPDGREVVFYGKPPDAAPQSSNELYVLDLTSGRTRRLAPDLVSLFITDNLPMAVAPDGRSVFVAVAAGNLHRVVAVPREPGAQPQSLLTLTMVPFSMDAGSDGSLYLDQTDRSSEVLRFAATGGAIERIAASPSYQRLGTGVALLLPDGRVLLPSRTAGRDRLQVTAPGKDPAPFLDTREETSPPAALLGTSEIAFVAGSAPAQSLAIASISEGRIARRLKGAKGPFDGLAASPDGKTLYYVAAGAVWAIPATDGEPRKVRAGDAVAVDPRQGDLIVQLREKEGIRLVRVPASGGPEREIPFRSEVRLGATPLAPNAVRADGRIVLATLAKDNWFWKLAVLDPETGAVEAVPLNYEGDIPVPGWTADGKILALAFPLRASLWRFRPAPAGR